MSTTSEVFGVLGTDGGRVMVQAGTVTLRCQVGEGSNAVHRWNGMLLQSRVDSKWDVIIILKKGNSNQELVNYLYISSSDSSSE